MASNEKNHDGVNETDDEIIDLDAESGDPSVLSASRDDDFEDDERGDLDVDITGDEAVDFADEEGGSRKGGGGKLKKMVAPALVLVMAAGVGGYIVMNPQIISGMTGGAPAAQQPVPYMAAAPAAPAETQVAVQDITEGSSFAQAEQAGQAEQAPEMFSNSLPQPTVNQNEVPRSPDEPVPDITETASVESPAQPETPVVAEVSAAAVVAEPEPAIVASAPEASAAEEGFPDEMAAAEESPAEQGSADDVADDIDVAASVAAAEEPAAPASTDNSSEEMYRKFSSDASSAEPAGAVGESIQIAQAETPAAPVVSAPAVEQPPAMPDQPLMPVPQAQEQQPASNPSEQASGTAAKPVPPSDKQSADVYYDGRIPTGPMAAEAGPCKVDPQLEPASQLVIVKKAYDATNPEALLASANRALQLKRYDSALEMFSQLYEKNPRDPRILMGKAVALQNSGMADTAIKTYEELLDIAPNNADAMLNMLGLLRQQYPSVALRRLLDLHDRHPNNPGVAAQVGITQADLGNPQDAMRFLGIASTLEPRNAQHLFNMAIVADRAGDFKGAIKYYEQALELDAVYAGGRSVPRETIYDRLAVLRRR